MASRAMSIWYGILDFLWLFSLTWRWQKYTILSFQYKLEESIPNQLAPQWNQNELCQLVESFTFRYDQQWHYSMLTDTFAARSTVLELGISRWELSQDVIRVEEEVKRLKGGEFPRGLQELKSSCDNLRIGLSYMTTYFFLFSHEIFVYAYITMRSKLWKVIFNHTSEKNKTFWQKKSR